MQTKVLRWGNSLGIRIPRSFASEARVEAGSSVDISVEDGTLHSSLSRYTLGPLKSITSAIFRKVATGADGPRGLVVAAGYVRTKPRLAHLRCPGWTRTVRHSSALVILPTLQPQVGSPSSARCLHVKAAFGHAAAWCRQEPSSLTRSRASIAGRHARFAGSVPGAVLEDATARHGSRQARAIRAGESAEVSPPASAQSRRVLQSRRRLRGPARRTRRCCCGTRGTRWPWRSSGISASRRWAGRPTVHAARGPAPSRRLSLQSPRKDQSGGARSDRRLVCGARHRASPACARSPTYLAFGGGWHLTASYGTPLFTPPRSPGGRRPGPPSPAPALRRWLRLALASLLPGLARPEASSGSVLSRRGPSSFAGARVRVLVSRFALVFLTWASPTGSAGSTWPSLPSRSTKGRGVLICTRCDAWRDLFP